MTLCRTLRFRSALKHNTIDETSLVAIDTNYAPETKDPKKEENTNSLKVFNNIILVSISEMLYIQI